VNQADEISAAGFGAGTVAQHEADPEAVAGAPRPGRRRRGPSPARERALNVVLPLIPILLIVTAWQLYVVIADPPATVLPGPLDTLEAVGTDWRTIARQTVPTLEATLIGFGAAGLLGIPLGLALVYSRVLYIATNPLLVLVNSAPKVAVAPLFIVWLGFGMKSVALMAFLVSFFPVVVSTSLGAASVAPGFIDLARSMGAGKIRTFTKIRFPHALPHIFGGLKIAISYALVGTVVGEFVASQAGLGYLIVSSNGVFNTARGIACVIWLSVLGVILFYAVRLVETRVLFWHPSTRESGRPGAANGGGR
jgi:NitT/TauT family transport system permease protein